MSITALPTPPSRADSVNFADRGDAFLGALPAFQSEANALATDVTTKQGIASTAATTATTQAGLATTAATTATTQAGIATTAASEASVSASNAVASFDSFDDRYLGAKTTNPTLDNDGNALLTGALYFNSVSGEMRVWSGTAWLESYLPEASYLTLNGTQTLTNKTIAFSSNTLTGVQPTLVSGTNITTINGVSLLSSGNLAIGEVNLNGTQTLTNKTIAFASNTLTDVASVTATQTLTNKTLTSPVLTTATTSGAFLFGGAIDETVFAVTGTTPALSPSNGTIQTWTLSGNSTPTAGTWTDGESLTLLVLDGTDFTITWTTVNVVWTGGNPPILDITKQNVIELWRVGGVIYGASVGVA